MLIPLIPFVLQVRMPTKHSKKVHRELRQERERQAKKRLGSDYAAYKSDIDDRTVDVHIKRLRDTLKISGQESLIKTIRGIGYRLSKD